jgi:hypothetical protein
LLFNFWGFFNIYSRYESLVGWIASKSFSPILWAVSSSWCLQKLLNLMQSHLSVPALISWVIGVLFRKFLAISISSSVFLK